MGFVAPGVGGGMQQQQMGMAANPGGFQAGFQVPPGQQMHHPYPQQQQEMSKEAKKAMKKQKKEKKNKKDKKDKKEKKKEKKVHHAGVNSAKHGSSSDSSSDSSSSDSD